MYVIKVFELIWFWFDKFVISCASLKLTDQVVWQQGHHYVHAHWVTILFHYLSFGFVQSQSASFPPFTQSLVNFQI